jgi:hypothetical protein
MVVELTSRNMNICIISMAPQIMITIGAILVLPTIDIYSIFSENTMKTDENGYADINFEIGGN